jgi:hypothetical protein
MKLHLNALYDIRRQILIAMLEHDFNTIITFLTEDLVLKKPAISDRPGVKVLTELV